MRADRDRAFEDAATQAYAYGVPVNDLNVYAGGRADRIGAAEYGVGQPDSSTDVRTNVLEEVADVRNYLVWWLHDIHLGLRDEDPSWVGERLREAIILWRGLAS